MRNQSKTGMFTVRKLADPRSDKLTRSIDSVLVDEAKLRKQPCTFAAKVRFEPPALGIKS